MLFDIEKIKQNIKENSRTVGVVSVSLLVILVAGVSVVNAKRIQNAFDPSSYADNTKNKDNSVAYDSSVFGANEDQNDEGLEMDDQSQKSADLNEGDQSVLDKKKNSDGLAVSDGSGSGNGSGTSAGATVSNDGSGTAINGGSGTGSGNGTGSGTGAGSGNGTGNGNGNGNGDGSGSNTGDNGGGGSKPTATPDPTYGGTIANEDDPTTNSGTITSNEDRNRYSSIELVQSEIPQYYVGQEVTIDELKKIMTVTVKIINGKTKKEETVSNPDLWFGTDSVVASKEAVSMKGYFNVEYYQSGYPMGSSVEHVAMFTYKPSKYLVTVKNSNSSDDNVYTNQGSIDLTEYYQKRLREMSTDTGSMTQLFLGWYAGTNSDKASMKTWDYSSQASGKVTLNELYQDVKEGFDIRLQKDADGTYQQVLVGYQGAKPAGGVLKVPEGVSKIALTMDADSDITALEIPSSVQVIDEASIADSLPECKAYQVTDTSGDSPFEAAADGILYSKDEKTMISVPSNYGTTIDLTGKSGELSIGTGAFAGFADESITLSVSSDLKIVKGLDNSKIKKIIVPKEDSDVSYLRYACAKEENGFSYELELDDKSTPNDYIYQNHCMLSEGGKTLVYVSENVGTSYETPKNVTTIASTAFVDLENLTKLTVASDVSKVENHAFAGMYTLSTVFVETTTTDIGTLFADAEKGKVNSKLKIYLKGSKKDDATYQAWAAALENIFGANAAEHIECTDADAELWINPKDGATYLVKDGTYILKSLPSSVASYEAPEGKTVVGIGKEAFNGCDKLKLIVLPEMVTSVESGAFTGCAALEVLSVPSKVEDTCSQETMEGANKLSSMKTVVSKEDSIQEDNCQVVYNQDGTKLLAVVSDYKGVLNLRATTKEIGVRAAAQCTEVTEVKASASQIEKIDAYAFIGCSGLTGLPIGDSCSLLGDYAFADCTGLSEITIQGKNLEIGDRVFAGCTGLNTVNYGTSLSESFATTGTYTFAGCTNLAKVYLSGRVVEIGTGAFAECKNLLMVSVTEEAGKDMKVIGDQAFCNCEKLDWNNFGNLEFIERIGDQAFKNVGMIHNFIFRRALKSIGAYAFAYDEPHENPASTFNFTDKHVLLETIGAHAFENNTGMKSLVFGFIEAEDGLVIGDSAFAGCTSISQITWGTNNLKSIGTSAFEDCTALQAANIGQQSKITSVGASAFAGCVKLTTVDLSSANKLTVIPSNLFGVSASGEYCESLQTVSMNAGITKIEENAFAGAYQMATLNVMGDKNVIDVAATAFYREDNDESMLNNLSVVVPETIYDAYINDAAWHTALTITHDYTKQVITSTAAGSERYYAGGYYIRNADGTYTLSHVDSSISNGFLMLDNTTKIADDAFNYEGKPCSKLTAVIIGNQVTTIGKNIFQGCTALEVVAFDNPNGVKIDTSLFGDTKVNDNFHIYIRKDTGSVYGPVKALDEYRLAGKILSTSDDWDMDSDTGAMYASYLATEDTDEKAVSGDGYVHQLMYLPRSYAGVFNVSNSTSYIYKEAMRGCKLITRFVMNGEKLISLGDYALAECDKLTYVDLKCYVTATQLNYIGTGAFKDDVSLYAWMGNNNGKLAYSTTIKVESVSKMGTGVFEGCTAMKAAQWGTLNLGDVPADTFKGCTSLGYLTASTTVSSAKTLRSFGDNCFEGCTSFTTSAGSLAAMGGLEKFGAECYKDCSKMSLLTLPSTMKEIGEDAFAGCDALTVIAMNTDQPVSLDGTGISAQTKTKLHAYVPISKESAYQSAWAGTGIDIIASAEQYRALNSMIYGCEDPGWTYYGINGHAGLVFAAAPNPSTTAAAVYETSATSTSNNYHVTEIGKDAFKDNKVIQTFKGYFVLKENDECYLEKIGDNAFKGCTSFTEMKLPDNFNCELTIGSSAYEGCTALESFKLSPNTEEIGDNAFKGCTSLTEVELLSRTTEITASSIGASAFEDCENLATFALHEYTTSIGSSAFAGTKDEFALDATYITKPGNCKLGEKIFGSAIPEGATITTQEKFTSAFIKTWGAQLQEEYQLTDEELLELFPNATQAMIDGISEEETSPEKQESSKASTAEPTTEPTTIEDTEASQSSEKTKEPESSENPKPTATTQATESPSNASANGN